MVVAITYRTGYKLGALRTVIVDDADSSVVLLLQGRIAITTGKLLHGTACRCSWWAEVLGTSGDDFAVAAD